LHQQLVLVCDTVIGRLLDQHMLTLANVCSLAADTDDAQVRGSQNALEFVVDDCRMICKLWPGFIVVSCLF
jgi:hypothetical protein